MIDNEIAQWGAVGVLVTVLLADRLALWRRDVEREKKIVLMAESQSANYEKMLLAYNEAVTASTSATVELVTIARVGRK